MKNIIFIMSMAVLTLSASACKTRKSDAQQALTSVEDNTYVEKTNSELVGTYWKLIELFGEPATAHENSDREAHIVFGENNHVSGDAGCNRFAGSYQLEEPNKITFSQMAVTRMMCLDGMETEDMFLQFLNTADSYAIKGDILSFSNAEVASLARFVAVDNQ